MHDRSVTKIHCREIDCPLCGASEIQRVLTGSDLQYGVPGEFHLGKCVECGHVFMNPQPHLESIGDCYPPNYGPHRSAESNKRLDGAGPGNDTSQPVLPEKPWYMRLGAGRVPGLKRLYEWLAESRSHIIPGQARGKSAVEIGCANGDFLLQLQSGGWTVQGVEPSAQAARTAEQRGLTVHRGTLETAELADESFDVVFAWMVIEHLPQPKTTLSHIHRILKPGGQFAFSVPNYGCWEPKVFGKHWDAFELPRHLQHFTPKTITRLLESTGFCDVKITHQRNVLNVVGSLGFKLRAWRPNSRLAKRLITWPHQPTMWPQLAWAPVAKLLAILRQGGRLTIIATRRDTAHSTAASNEGIA